MAARVRDVGVRKAGLDVASMLALGMLGGAFIALGAALATLAVTGVDIGYGLRRLVGGVAFSLGLILVLVAGGGLLVGTVYWFVYLRPGAQER
jgi:formate/nitrite transporter FocA (FNT family)